MIAGSLIEHPEAAAFARSFQERHVEEIAFLLDHREVQLRLGRWPDTEKHERRIAAHLTALEAHGPGALDAAGELLGGPDRLARPGAAYVLAALGDAGRRAAVMASLSQQAPPALLRALALAPAPKLAVELERAIAAGAESAGVAAATLLGMRRETPAERLLELAATVDSAALVDALALGLARTGSRAAWPALNAALRRNPDDIRLVAAMVLAGDPEGLRRARLGLTQARGPLPGETVAVLARAVAMAGDAADVPLLAAHLGAAPASVLPALGLLGVTDAVEAILPQLESPDPAVRRAAGLALETLTGANLPANLEEEDRTDDAEDADDADLDADLFIKLEARTLPVCTDAGAWRAFWRDTAKRFAGAGRRFRRGAPWSEAGVAEALATLPLFLAQRQLEADELAARTGSAPLDAAWPLARQRQHLALLRQAADHR